MDIACRLLHCKKQLLLAFLFLYSAASYANFQKAMEVYSAGNFQEAKIAFETLAAIGNRSALFNLGVMHYRGEAVEKNVVKAYVLMKIANNGFEDASFSGTTNKILATLSDAQKKQAEIINEELEPYYGIENIKGDIFPVLLSDDDCPPDLVPIKVAEPKYPNKESQKGRMGLTDLETTVSPEGYPRDIKVLTSVSDYFSKSSVRALKKSFYEPPIDRQPHYGVRYRFSYFITGTSVGVRTKALAKELDGLKVAANSGDVVAQYKYAVRLNVFRSFKKYLKKINLEYRTANEWFTKAAYGGVPNAQFEIGRNMIEGRGCKVDRKNGYKWINAAAISGYAPAQNMLARSMIAESEIKKQKSRSIISWLRNASLAGDFTAKLLLAWELSTSLDGDVRNGSEALELLNIDPENYFDDVRINETKAAAYAEIGDFNNALKYQKKAQKLAKKLKWKIPLIGERMGLYEHAEPYRGGYF